MSRRPEFFVNLTISSISFASYFFLEKSKVLYCKPVSIEFNTLRRPSRQASRIGITLITSGYFFSKSRKSERGFEKFFMLFQRANSYLKASLFFVTLDQFTKKS